MQHTRRWTYLFGNTYAQNLARQGGFFSCPCTGTRMFLARVPRGRFLARPEFWTGPGDTWSRDHAKARSVSRRFGAHNEMHPRLLKGSDGRWRWVSVTAPDEFLASSLIVSRAPRPWGPWVTTTQRTLVRDAGWHGIAWRGHPRLNPHCPT